MRIDPKFKRQLATGVVSSIGRFVEMAMEAHMPQFPAVLKQQLIPQVPTYGELLVLSIPLATWIPKEARVPNTKKRDYALGASLYVLPELVKETGCRIAATRVGRVGDSHRAASPYVTKAERMPFQTDIGY